MHVDRDGGDPVHSGIEDRPQRHGRGEAMRDGGKARREETRRENMKKQKALLYMALAVALLCVAVIGAFGCNGGCDCRGYDCFDTKYHFDRAIIRMPDGEIKEIEIEYWADSEGEQLTLTAKDGSRYLVSSINCILIEDN